MVKTIHIKCPLCREKSELFLSMNPTVIVLNCPECWTPLMYSQGEIQILSEHELSNITSSSSLEPVLENFFDDENKNQDCSPVCKKHAPVFKNKINHDTVFKSSPKYNRDHITPDDIVDLRIELEQSRDVLQFIDTL